MSPAPTTCTRPCWIQTVIILVGLAVLAFWSMRQPLTSDADDCAARGRPADCWKDEAYDINGHRVLTNGLRKKR